jgi:hypothetical protein
VRRCFLAQRDGERSAVAAATPVPWRRWRSVAAGKMGTRQGEGEEWPGASQGASGGALIHQKRSRRAVDRERAGAGERTRGARQRARVRSAGGGRRRCAGWAGTVPLRPSAVGRFLLFHFLFCFSISFSVLPFVFIPKHFCKILDLVQYLKCNTRHCQKIGWRHK